MGFKGQFIAEAIGGTGRFGTGIQGFAGALARAAEEDRLAAQRTEDIAREDERFNTLRNDNFTSLLMNAVDEDMQVVPAGGQPMKGFAEALSLNGPDGTPYSVMRRTPKPEVRVPSPSDWEVIEGAEGFARVNRLTGETTPVEGVTPRPRQQAAPNPPNLQVVPTDGGLLHVNPETSTARPIVGPDGQPITRTPPVPDSARQAIIQNRQTIAAIDRALSAIDANPEAVGWRNAVLPDFLESRLDPEGVTARAEISDLGSMIILDRSGAAVQASEFERIRPFIPSANDNAATVRAKLQRFRQIAQDEQRLYEESFGRGASGGYTAQFPENPY